MSNLREYKKGMSIQVSKDFWSSEFDCKCDYPDCTKTIINLDHVTNLQVLRDRLSSPIRINSGYRCEKHNKDIGGASESRHKKGDASDLEVEGYSPNKVASESEHLFSGLGRYNTFTHVDSRPNESARWDFRSKKD